MSYKITDECISCAACEPECPNTAITEGETIYIVDPDKCTECVGSFASPKCVEICPVGAYAGEPFRPEDPREVRFDAHKCQRYFVELEETTGLNVCGLCLYVCPNGRN